MKQKQLPIKIHKLEALLRRLSEKHPNRSRIEKEYMKRMTGYKGELSLEYYLSFLDKNYYIFHDLRLKGRKYFFQMDVLILTSKYILIIESKNISGTLIFDKEYNQLIRVSNGVEEGFQDPILQVKHQEYQLKQWLIDQFKLELPLESVVVITKPNAIIKKEGGEQNSKLKVIKASNLIFEIEKLSNQNNDNKKISNKQLSQLSNALILHDKPNNPNILKEFNIQTKEILTGVYCDFCKKLSMIRAKGKWCCPYCQKTSKHAHLQALKDYYYLIGPSITNQNFRTFTNLKSRTTSYKLLSSLNYKFSGKTSSTTYHIE